MEKGGKGGLGQRVDTPSHLHSGPSVCSTKLIACVSLGGTLRFGEFEELCRKKNHHFLPSCSGSGKLMKCMEMNAWNESDIYIFFLSVRFRDVRKQEQGTRITL